VSLRTRCTNRHTRSRSSSLYRLLLVARCCSGEGKLGVRVDFCPACSYGFPWDPAPHSSSRRRKVVMVVVQGGWKAGLCFHLQPWCLLPARYDCCARHARHCLVPTGRGVVVVVVVVARWLVLVSEQRQQGQQQRGRVVAVVGEWAWLVCLTLHWLQCSAALVRCDPCSVRECWTLGPQVATGGMVVVVATACLPPHVAVLAVQASCQCKCKVSSSSNRNHQIGGVYTPHSHIAAAGWV
jgi:hypothetical protein